MSRRPRSVSAHPIGTVRIDKGLLQRRIEGGVWERPHRVNWEAERGPIPCDSVLVHLGDPLDCRPSNWRLVPRSALILMHARCAGGLYAAPAEAREAIIAAALLEDKVKRTKASAGLLPRTGAEARRLGEPHYFSGLPCSRGHIAKRSVKRGVCLECERKRR